MAGRSKGEDDKEWYLRMVKGVDLDPDQQNLIDAYNAIERALSNDENSIRRLGEQMLAMRDRGVPIDLERAAFLTKQQAAITAARVALRAIALAQDHPIHRLIDGARKNVSKRRGPSLFEGRLRSLLLSFVLAASSRLPGTTKLKAAKIASQTAKEVGVSQISPAAILAYESHQNPFGFYEKEAVETDRSFFASIPADTLTYNLKIKLAELNGGNSVDLLLQQLLSDYKR